MRQPLGDIVLVEGNNELNIEMTPITIGYTIRFSPFLDGEVRNTIVPVGSWSELRDGPGVEAYSGPSTGIWAGFDSVGGGKWFTMSRGLMFFDTSSIQPGDKILSASLLGHVFDLLRGPAEWWPSWAIYPAETSYDDHLVPGDFQGLGNQPVSGALPTSSIAEGQYNEFNFTPDGLKSIVRGGITKLGTREATYDAPNISPPGVQGGSYLGIASVFSVMKPPILAVTLAYTY